MKHLLKTFALLTLFGTSLVPAEGAVPEIHIGSKKFTEAVVLGEALTLLVKDATFEAQHLRELGGTRILWNALRRGEIDAYVEYTGTLREEIFAGRTLETSEALRHALAKEGLRMSAPLGFNNTYALGVTQDTARTYNLRRISDLRAHPDLFLGFTNEFLDRGDGWQGLREHYALPHQEVRGLDHALAYRGLEAGNIQVIDLYSTDAEIAYYDLFVLEDDRSFFPSYHALVIYREDLPDAVKNAFLRLEGRIDETTMRGMNARAKIDRVPEAQVAADFLLQVLGTKTKVETKTFWRRLLHNTWAHLTLVGLSLALAVLVALPLGILASRHRRWGEFVLGLVGMFQTIPSLALLVFMIPVLGIGNPPALAALFLYSLLPIVRNTAAGLRAISPELLESADALGLPPWVRLWHIEMPLAASSILAGIKTSAVINIGTATLGALIGAGGYGQPILTGIRLDNVGLILEGAVPAAALAFLAQGFFELMERWLVPRGLQLGRAD
jgi:osmoprotectant transport system permease protein